MTARAALGLGHLGRHAAGHGFPIAPTGWPRAARASWRCRAAFLSASGACRQQGAAGAADIPATQRAVVLPSPGPPESLEVREVAVRRPGQGEVLVRVDACAVAYRDTLDRRGAFPFIMPDAVLGHEIAGTVVEVGGDASAAPPGAATTTPPSGKGGARRLGVGDRVVSLHWDQSESWPAPLTPSGPVKSFLGLTLPGGYAEYCTAPTGCFVRVPPSWTGTAVEAAPVMSTYGTVWQGAVVRGGLRSGDTVLVTGASGGVGSAAVRLCSRMGCRVVAVTSSPGKRDFVESLGADHVIVEESGSGGEGGDGAAMAFNKRAVVMENPPSMAVECTGGPGFQASLRSLSPEGTLVLVGNVNNSVGQLPIGLCILKSLSVVGSDSIAAEALVDLFKFMDRGAGRQLCAGGGTGPRPLRPEVHSTLPLESVAEAHALLEARGVSGRIVLQVSDDTWA